MVTRHNCKSEVSLSLGGTLRCTYASSENYVLVEMLLLLQLHPELVVLGFYFISS
jgi:hypothetical protein